MVHLATAQVDDCISETSPVPVEAALLRMHYLLIRNQAIVSPPFIIIRQCLSKWWSLNSSYKNYYPQQQEDRTDARKKGHVKPQICWDNKVYKKRKKRFWSNRVFTTRIDWSISFGSRRFSGEHLCTETFKKGQFPYFLTGNSQSIL